MNYIDSEQYISFVMRSKIELGRGGADVVSKSHNASDPPHASLLLPLTHLLKAAHVAAIM